MGTPQTINGLMRHLRNECNISISGSRQKQQLTDYGYYHGYKGYRFFNKDTNRIPYTDFSEVVAVIEYDNNLKAAIYPAMMFLETAIKNIVCNMSVIGLKDDTFDAVYKNRMQDNPSNTKVQLNRLKLRNTVYSRIASRYREEEHKDSQMVRHFYNRGEDVPVWSVSEIIYMSDLASYFSCLDISIRENILRSMGMLDISIDTDRNLLTNLLYTMKALRNAFSHNNIIFDTRFKDRKISPVVKKWTEKETGIRNITLYSLVDYLIIICCMLNKIDFSDVRVKKLFRDYRDQNEILKNSVSRKIYDMIIPANVAAKISSLENYLSV